MHRDTSITCPHECIWIYVEEQKEEFKTEDIEDDETDPEVTLD